MRGSPPKQTSMVMLASPESVVPKDHPIRRIKKLADAALVRLSPTFDAMYSSEGRPSIPPERLLKGSLLIALFSVRSERLFCEQLGYNLLYRWFLDMDMAEAPFDHSTFSRNRDRLLEHEVAKLFFQAIVTQAKCRHLMSPDHFTVDGTLIEAWASAKSFKAKDDDKDDKPPPDDPGNPTVDFHGEKRCNDTHASTTDPDAKLARKGTGREARLSYSAHALMENRNGMLVDLQVAEANGRAEREVALQMLEETKDKSRSITVGADKGYDTADFIAGCRDIGVVPHVAQHINAYRGSAIDDRTTRHEGYEISQRKRKLVEEIFGWLKTVGGFRRTRFIGRVKTQLAAYLAGAAYNLVRLARLEMAAG